ncbi:hypothetical protein CY35_15G062900 [Sphagnum magellanicum]|nr:hypothetical protein CY35_15G062900 [Sphagnum magellanicum]
MEDGSDGAPGGGGGGGGRRNSLFWKTSLPQERILFVNSPEKLEFKLFLVAMEEAVIVAMDAEWKPVRKPGAVPRVSILQMSCRMGENSRAWSSLMEKDLLIAMDSKFQALGLETELESREEYSERRSTEENSEEMIEPEEFAPEDLDRNSQKDDDPENCLDQKIAESEEDWRRKGEDEEEEESKLVKGEEIVFVLDLLALSASAFGLAMKAMLTSPHILKLGFAFKQDLLHLTTTFPGSEAHGCFDKVEPYMDLGKLYKQIVNAGGSICSQQHGRKKPLVGRAFSLAAITEVVLGMPLCKDSQCSDWEQRPLTREQIDYAAADAHCLLALFDSLLPDALHTIVTGKGGKESKNKIYPSMRGSATEMVKAALGCSALFSRSFKATADQSGLPPKYAKFVKKYGERLLVNVLKEGADKASSHQRARGYHSRKTLKDKDAREVEDWDWVGPAPWDVAANGDGIPKFLCDIMVEGLARQLRCVGIDAASPSEKKSDPRQLVEQAERESRVLLTKDSKLLRRRLVPDGLAYRVKTRNKWDQLAEIIETFKIKISESDLLSRCVKCNGDFIPLPLTAKEAAAAAPWHQEIPSSVLQSCDEFWQCSACHHMYWQGFQFSRALQQFSAVCLTQDAYRTS